MAKHKLTPLQVKNLQVGTYGDGGNLYLRVTSPEARQWLFRYKRGGDVTVLGLGSANVRGLASARKIAEAMNVVLADGGDPNAVLRKETEAGKTFRVYAGEVMDEKRPTFRSAKHAKQWPATLERYAYPVIGDKRPGAITTDDMQKILRPIWSEKTETAERVRQRIEVVLNYAFTKEDIDKRNPAAWHGILQHLGLGARRRRGKQPMAPYGSIPDIMSELRASETTVSLCLQFIILTWVRSGEARGMEWSEINEGERLWTIPAHRMKAGNVHQVPLSDEAMQILTRMRTRRRNDTARVFPGRDGGLLSDTGLNKVLHALPTVIALDERAVMMTPTCAGTHPKPMRATKGATVHGMRASARSWASARTSFDRDVLEMALAHTIKDKTEAAYQRDPMIEKRSMLMTTWAQYCSNGNVVPFPSLARAVG